MTPNPEGGWDVKAPEAERASDHKYTQAEAISRAEEITRNTGGQTVIHKTDGTPASKPRPIGLNEHVSCCALPPRAPPHRALASGGGGAWGACSALQLSSGVGWLAVVCSVVRV